MRRPLLLLIACCLSCANPTPGRSEVTAAGDEIVAGAPVMNSSKQATDTFTACPTPLPDGMVCIPGGSFLRGGEEGAHATPAETITISTFLLDVHEVTNAQWNECVAAGECRRLTRFLGYLGADQPAVSMRWDEAVSFCERAGGRLPTEAEWERAASGPDDTLYPWGNEPGIDCEFAIVRTRADHGCGRGTTWPVMSRPAFGYGLYDMAGNVWEICSDFYDPEYRGKCEKCDPKGPETWINMNTGQKSSGAPNHVTKGGSFLCHISYCMRYRPGARHSIENDSPTCHTGFRCVKDL